MTRIDENNQRLTGTPMTQRLWSSLAFPRYQQATVETAVDQVKKDLLQVIENGRDVASSLDAIGVSTTISHLVVSSQPILVLVKLGRIRSLGRLP